MKTLDEVSRDVEFQPGSPRFDGADAWNASHEKGFTMKTVDELLALADECFILGDLWPIRAALCELIADAERVEFLDRHCSVNFVFKRTDGSTGSLHGPQDIRAAIDACKG